MAVTAERVALELLRQITKPSHKLFGVCQKFFMETARGVVVTTALIDNNYRHPYNIELKMCEIFRELEYSAEAARLEALVRLLREKRGVLLQLAANGSLGPTQLDGYEAVVQQAARGGLNLPLMPGVPTPVRWSRSQAIFFASTVLTTIGYGNIAPETVEGRVFCILFALVGIPLTVSALATLGALLAGALPTPPEARGLRHSLASAAIATSVLILYIAVGAALFITWERDWSFFEGFYFCFVTMTTIGFGDLVPSTPQYMLLCTVYILLGLSLTSTIVEMVRQQYSRSWRTLQALAEALAQRHSTDVAADLLAALSQARVTRTRDLHLAVHQISKELAKQNVQPKLVQVIIYETSL